MKKILFLVLTSVLLTGCEKKQSQLISSSLISEEIPNSSSSIPSTPSSIPSSIPNTSTSTPSSTSRPIPASSDQSGSEVTRPEYNPDGSKTLEMPLNRDAKIDIAEWTSFNFEEGTMPENCRYIYGNNFGKGEFYSATAGGGLKMNENSKSRKGVQLPFINSWQKLEIRIYIGKFFQCGSSVNEKDPVFTIYGFDDNGLIKDTKTIDMISSNNVGSYVRVYMPAEEVSYLEIRATNLPYKSSQVYNFSITHIDLKGWPYPIK